jgi:hypothetical protein
MRDERPAAEPATAPGHSVPGPRVRELGRTFPFHFPPTGSRSAERRTSDLQPTTAGPPSSSPEHAWRTVIEDGARRAECVCGSAVTGFLRSDRQAVGCLCSRTRPNSGRDMPAARRYRIGRRTIMALSARSVGSRIRATDSLVPAGNCRFVRGSATRKPASWQRRLTIRWRVTILRWTPDYPETVVAPVVLRRARVEPGVWLDIAAGSPRSGRCAEGCRAGLLVAALTFHVTNDTSSRRSEFAERRSFGGVRPASCRRVTRRSAAGRRSPVRWRAGAE